MFIATLFFLTLMGRAAHTQRNSPGGSTPRGHTHISVRLVRGQTY